MSSRLTPASTARLSTEAVSVAGGGELGADAVVLLRRVGDVEVDGEGAHQAHDVEERRFFEALHEALEARRVRVLPQRARRRPRLLDEVEELVAPLLADDVAEDAAHLADVGAQAGV